MTEDEAEAVRESGDLRRKQERENQPSAKLLLDQSWKIALILSSRAAAIALCTLGLQLSEALDGMDVADLGDDAGVAVLTALDELDRAIECLDLEDEDEDED